jgi:hypothetical protein
MMSELLPLLALLLASSFTAHNFRKVYLMINANEGKTAIVTALVTTNATAEHTLDIDTSGSDQANFYIIAGVHNSGTEAINTVSVYESDTVTQATNMTLIASLSSGATATSTSASNILPLAAVQALGGIIQEIQVDLRKRKKYMGIAINTGGVTAGCPVAIMARLTRNGQSADTAAQKDAVDLGATTVSGCMQVITG